MEPEVTKGVWPVMLTPFKENGEVDWSGVDALTDWYIEAGVAGLFAVCLSSEMYELTEEEKISLVRRVVKRSAGKVPVVASGTFGGSIKRQAQFIKKLWEQGAKAAVVIVCQLARRDEEDDIWLQNVSRLLELTDEVPLGFYECPLPYHRLLTPEILRWAASTKRFFFYKDTSAQTDLIEDKLEAIKGTSIRWFNADSLTLLDSLLLGGDGFSGIDANFCPELYVWLCENFQREPESSRKLQRFLGVIKLALSNKYPASSKMFLQLCGLPISPVCRTGKVTFTEREIRFLKYLRELIKDWHKELGI